MCAPIRIVIFLSAAAAAGASSALAQAADRPGVKSANPIFSLESVAALLQSNDPREQAWGAWYAGRHGMPELSPLLQRVALQHVGGLFLDSAAAADAAIDSLIQLRAKVPEGLIKAIYDQQRNAAALILASHDVDAAAAFLLDVAVSGEAEPWFAAANLLLSDPTKRRFAPILMKSLTVTAVITISDDGKHASGLEGGSCFTISCDFGATGAPGFRPGRHTS